MIDGVSFNNLREPNAMNYTSRKSSKSDSPARFAMEDRTSGSVSSESAVSQENNDRPDSLVITVEGDGFRGVLYWGKDILASVGGIGGTVNVKYHEDSTKDDPIVIAWGLDSMGKEYEEVIHLNHVNPKYATPAEMIALNAHLSKSGHKDSTAAGPGALWSSLGMGHDPNTKMDFEQHYKDYIAMQQLGNNKSGAALYQLELERYLFFYQQKEK